MSIADEACMYTDSHEWVRKERDGIVTIGITDFAQHALGDVVYVAEAKKGQVVGRGSSVCVIDSIKISAELFAPVHGTIIEFNHSLTDAPEHVNNDPYGKGWMIKLKMSDPSELDQLLTPAKYNELIQKGGGH